MISGSQRVKGSGPAWQRGGQEVKMASQGETLPSLNGGKIKGSSPLRKKKKEDTLNERLS